MITHDGGCIQMMALKVLNDRRSCYGVTPAKKEFYKELFFSYTSNNPGTWESFLSFLFVFTVEVIISEVLKKISLFGDGLNGEEGWGMKLNEYFFLFLFLKAREDKKGKMKVVFFIWEILPCFWILKCSKMSKIDLWV